MTERGFLPGQGSDRPSATTSIIFCTATDKFATRWPDVLERVDERYGCAVVTPGTCLDLVVTGSESDGIVSVELEGLPIEALGRAGAPTWSSPSTGDALEARLEAVRLWIESELPIA